MNALFWLIQFARSKLRRVQRRQYLHVDAGDRVEVEWLNDTAFVTSAAAVYACGC